jgi:putative ABC transport system permease protein
MYNNDYEVVLGAYVAEQLGLKTGDSFHSIHGFNANMGEAHEENAYKVAGVLQPSNTVLDQLILCTVESIWKTHAHTEEEIDDADVEHEGEAHHEEEVEPKEITALLLKFKNPMAAIQLPRLVNETTDMQAALPAIEITRLYSLLGVGIDLMRAVAIAIIVISGISIFISLYHALNERRFELALMRSLGASRWKLFGMIILEGLLLAILGYILGMLLSRFGLYILSNAMESTYRYSLNRFGVLQEEIGLLGITLLIGFLAALIPAISAYRTDISKTLSHA